MAKFNIELKLLPAEIENNAIIRQKAAEACGFAEKDLSAVKVLRRSIDARSRQPHFLLRIEVYANEMPTPEPALSPQIKPLEKNAKKVLIVGAGPAGYFAALELLSLGLKPIIVDRGKDVRTRRRDLRAIQQEGIVNPDSNYCFGEGGAGTYSDGKLYTRSQKRGNIEKILRLLVEHGAKSDILIDAHPHIGSNKLPQVVENIRETILHYGGEIHFNALVTDFILQKNQLKGVIIHDKQEILADALILATGHSARDIYYLLFKKNILIEPKPFALGVRVEHTQSWVDSVQYKQSPRDEHLPAASYSLVCQVQGRGVFSFCMCPGGLVVPASTAPGEIVVNGMSMSRRDSPFANSGVVTSIELEDLKKYEKEGVFAGLALQKSIEKTMFMSGDGTQKAPAQRLTDFIQGKLSTNLPPTSYIPGLIPAPVHTLLPAPIAQRLRTGLKEFGKKMHGYYTSEANVIATESRTSAPIRIPRDPETYMHPQIVGLFPCGEGAGYAGGILSAAMDGQNVAQAIKRFLG